MTDLTIYKTQKQPGLLEPVLSVPGEVASPKHKLGLSGWLWLLLGGALADRACVKQ